MSRCLKNYGFAILVMAGAAMAGYLAATVDVPDPVPDFALKAREIYRLEIGMAFFTAFYLAAMAMVLALDGRGFAEFGSRGLKPGRVVDKAAAQQHQGLRQQTAFDRSMKRRLKEHEERLERLERKRVS